MRLKLLWAKDRTISDALTRKHQCATYVSYFSNNIELDFQLPERFGLLYQNPEPTAPTDRPFMTHRAILGSVERMIAIITEHTAGKCHSSYHLVKLRSYLSLHHIWSTAPSSAIFAVMQGYWPRSTMAVPHCLKRSGITQRI
jgi:hypothetical protein